MSRWQVLAANRERSLVMIKHQGSTLQALIINHAMRCVAGLCLALLPWCPTSTAQPGNQAPASAEEVKQLRDVVQNLLARVTELEHQLKQQQAWPTARTEKGSAVAAQGPSGDTEAVTSSPGGASASGWGPATSSAT